METLDLKMKVIQSFILSLHDSDLHKRRNDCSLLAFIPENEFLIIFYSVENLG